MVKKYPTWEGKRIEMEMAEIMFFAMDMFFFVFFEHLFFCSNVPVINYGNVRQTKRFRTETFERINLVHLIIRLCLLRYKGYKLIRCNC